MWIILLSKFNIFLFFFADFTFSIQFEYYSRGMGIMMMILIFSVFWRL